LALAGGSIAGTVTGAVALGRLNEVEAVARGRQENTELIVAKLQESRENMAELEARLDALNATANLVLDLANDMRAQNKLITMDNHLTSLIQAIEGEQNRISEGIVAAMQQRLDPNLIEVDQIIEAVDDLREKAGKAGFDLPALELSWIYQLPAGFLAHKNGKFLVFVHIPIHIPGNVLMLYEFMKIPVAINASVHSITIEPEGKYIAVNPDRDGFLILTERDLDKCIKVGEHHMCPKSNFQHKKPSSFCLSALYWRDKNAAHKMCKTAIATDAVQIIQTEADSFYIFHPEKRTLIIQCGRKEEKIEEWRGSRLIKITSGCRGFGDSYEVQSHPDFSASQILEASNLTWTIRQLTLEIPKMALDTYLPQPPTRPVMVEDLVTQMRLMQSQDLIGNNYYPFSFASSAFGGFFTLLFVIGCLCCCCYCCRAQLTGCLHKGIGDFCPSWETGSKTKKQVVIEEEPIVIRKGTLQRAHSYDQCYAASEVRPLTPYPPATSQSQPYVMIQPVRHPHDLGSQTEQHRLHPVLDPV